MEDCEYLICICYPVDYAAEPALLGWKRFGHSRRGYFPEQRDKIRRHDRRKLYAGGGTGWYMDLFTNQSKPCSIGQKHSHCFANYSNSIVMGYPGRKLPWKLLTIVHTGKPPPESPVVCPCFEDSVELIVDLLRRKLINYGSRRSRLSEGGLFSVRCWFGFPGNQLVFGPGTVVGWLGFSSSSFQNEEF